MLFFSKCIAGGFSAALVLLWWPQLVPGASLSAWLGRGVAFTLAFELMLLALRPLEEALWGTSSGSRMRERIDTASERLRRGDTSRRLGSSAAIAAVALTVPGLLIADGLSHQPRDKADGPARAVRVVHVTKVVRPVTVKRVVAEKEVPVPVTVTRTVAPQANSTPAKAKQDDTPRSKVKAPAERQATERDPQPTTGQSPSSDSPKPGANGSSAERDSVHTSLSS